MHPRKKKVWNEVICPLNDNCLMEGLVYKARIEFENGQETQGVAIMNHLSNW